MAHELVSSSAVFGRIMPDLGVPQSGMPLSMREEGQMPSLAFAERIPDELMSLIPKSIKLIPQPRRTMPKTLPDVMLPSGNWVVCSRFRDVVEKIEPGVHQFFSVTLMNGATGEEISSEQGYFFLNILNYLSPMQLIDLRSVKGGVVDSEEVLSNGRIFRRKSISVIPSLKIANFTIRRAVIGACHLWRVFGRKEGGVYVEFPNTVFVSDELADRLRGENISGIRFVRTIEI